LSDAGHATPASQQVSPNVLSGVAYPADQADPSNYNPSRQLLPAFRVFADVVDRVLHRANFLGVFIGNFDFKGLFKSHYQLYGVERVGTKVVYKGGVLSYFSLVYSQLLHDDLFYFFVNGCHAFSLRFRIGREA